MIFALHFITAALLFMAVDSVWIAVVANKFYKRQLGGLLRAKPLFGPAVLFYALYIWALLYFAVDPGLQANDPWLVVRHAALLGLTMYATYDLTNLATLKNWPRKLTVVDMTWGTVLTTAISLLTFIIFRP